MSRIEREVTLVVCTRGKVDYVSLETLMGDSEQFTETAFETCLLIKQLERWYSAECVFNPVIKEFHAKLLDRIGYLITTEAAKARTLRKTKQLNYILYLVFNGRDMHREALMTVHNRYIDLRNMGKQYTPLPSHKVGIIQKEKRVLYQFRLPDRTFHCFA